MLKGRFEINRLAVLAENKSWVKAMDATQISVLANTLKAGSVNNMFARNIGVPKSSGIVLYSYTSENKTAYKTMLKKGMNIEYNQKFKRRFKDTGFTLASYEFEGFLKTLCDLPDKGASVVQYEMAIMKFKELLEKGLDLLEDEIINEPTEEDMKCLLRGFKAGIAVQQIQPVQMQAY